MIRSNRTRVVLFGAPIVITLLFAVPLALAQGQATPDVAPTGTEQAAPEATPAGAPTGDAAATPAQPQAPPPIKWQPGPMTADLGGLAELQVPEGFLFADKAGTLKLLELTHNLASGDEVGTIVPAGDGPGDSWFVVFEFGDVGYVKDDEKNAINADALLKSIRESTDEGNKERKKKGWHTFSVVGWERPPYYDETTHNLTWAIRGSSDTGSEVINHSVRILGRHGTMRVDLVQDPEYYANTVSRFDALMSGFTFGAGHRYADFVQGDKVAAYGLTALIVGGASAAALKTGLLAKFGNLLIGLLLAMKKLVILLVVAVGAFFKRVWSSITGRTQRAAAQETPPTPGT